MVCSGWKKGNDLAPVIRLRNLVLMGRIAQTVSGQVLVGSIVLPIQVVGHVGRIGVGFSVLIKSWVRCSIMNRR